MDRLTADTALEARLARRFRLAESRLSLGSREVALIHPADAEELIDEDAFERDERLPYWADVWPSSRVLGAHLLTSDGRGKRFLELGCGSGLVAVCAAMSGYDVTATDYYEDALLFTRANVRRNAHVEPHVRMVDWRRLPRDLGTFDFVVASDVLYERPYASLVARAIHATLAPHGLALVADPGRIAAEEFVKSARAAGLAVDEPEIVPWSEGQIRQRIRIYRIRHR